MLPTYSSADAAGLLVDILSESLAQAQLTLKPGFLPRFFGTLRGSMDSM